MRYQEIVNNLAVVAHNRATLPSLSLFATGVSTVSDAWGVDSNTTWDHAVRGFSKQLVGLSLNHSPDQNWQLDPVVAQPQLEALRAAFGWPLYGAPADGSSEMELLRAPHWMETSGYHFDVADQLASLPARWLHVGTQFDVPECAAFKGHCGDTYVWVNPRGLTGLSEFTLIILDISTVDINTLAYKSVQVTVERTLSLDKTKQTGTVTERWKASQEEPELAACRHVVRAGTITIQPTNTPTVPDVDQWIPQDLMKGTTDFANQARGPSGPTMAPLPSIQSEPKQVQSSQLR